VTSDIVWDYFFKAVQRPSLLPKDSAEFQGWYDALPQTQPKKSEAFQGWYKAWEKATPQLQPKKSEAFREWLRTVRENASQRSVDAHQWFKSKPPTADTDVVVMRLWYGQKPTLRTSRTGGDAKSSAGREYGARVGATIGQWVGLVATPYRRAMVAAAHSKDYQCRQCGCGYKMTNLKRNMISHLSSEANRECLAHYSESRDEKEKEWVRLAQDQETIDAAKIPQNYTCRQCGGGVNKQNLTRGMVSHLRSEANRECLAHYSESIDEREIEWVRRAQGQ